MMEGPCADSEEKREPAGDIDTVVVDGLKVLDPKRPIREADIRQRIEQMWALLKCAIGSARDHRLCRSYAALAY
jgi:hypothetical protein